MTERPRIKVEVAYAKPKKQTVISLSVFEGSSVREAIEQSGIMYSFPEINLDVQPVGVFSKPRELTDEVRAGDRIEIYRPLCRDPKESRRRRAAGNR